MMTSSAEAQTATLGPNPEACGDVHLWLSTEAKRAEHSLVSTILGFMCAR